MGVTRSCRTCGSRFRERASLNPSATASPWSRDEKQVQERLTLKNSASSPQSRARGYPRMSAVICAHINRDMWAYHPPHGGISTATCGHITRHMRTYHPPHAGMSPATCGHITRHMPAYQPSHAGISPATCGHVTRHMRTYHPSHADMSSDTCGHVTRHMRTCHPTHADMSPDTCPHINRHMPACHLTHEAMSPVARRASASNVRPSGSLRQDGEAPAPGIAVKSRCRRVGRTR